MNHQDNIGHQENSGALERTNFKLSIFAHKLPGGLRSSTSQGAWWSPQRNNCMSVSQRMNAERECKEMNRYNGCWQRINRQSIPQL